MQTQINTILSRLSITHRVVQEKMLTKVGIHPGQAQVLSSLWVRDGQTQAEICRNLNISSATVNLLVSKLKKKNFVTCQKCPTDKRFMRVHLTNTGRQIRPRIEKQILELEEILLTEFSDTEKLLVMMLMEKMKNNLESYFSPK